MTQRFFEFTPIPHNGISTSVDAAESMRDHVGRLEGYVLAAIKSTGGSTCDELEVLCGLSHQCCSARVNGLMRKGIISDSGDRRSTRSGRKAIVWVAA